MNNLTTKFNFLILSFFSVTGSLLHAQNLTNEVSVEKITIAECYSWARENFPLINQMNMIDKSTQYSLSNASIGNLPQVSIKGQASYQSAVTSLPINIPNIEIPTISKDQYKVYGELYQPLTNFSNVQTQKREIELNGKIEKQQIELELYQLKERVNQIYFGTLLINEKIEQFELVKIDIDSTLENIEVAIKNGTATLTDKKLLDVERILIDQKIEENKANELAFLKMLSIITGKNISEKTQLEKPNLQTVSLEINRPELELFKLQNQAIFLQEKKLTNNLMPSIGLFAQGGYGRPALNFLSNNFDFYYIGGVKFNWNLSQFYSFRNTKKTLGIFNDKISTQRAAFIFTTTITQTQQSAEVTKYNNLLNSDKKILELRNELLTTAKVELENGLITTIDYVKFLNQVNKAKQTLLLHETQMLLAQHNLKTTTGN